VRSELLTQGTPVHISKITLPVRYTPDIYGLFYRKGRVYGKAKLLMKITVASPS
jgi:hypothetical protein